MGMRRTIATWTFTISKTVVKTGYGRHTPWFSLPQLPSSTIPIFDVWTWDEAEGLVLPFGRPFRMIGRWVC
jgi:hypothetical protein